MIGSRIKAVAKATLTPTFFIFFGIALAIWYLNRLSNEYQTVVDVPFTITGRVDSMFLDGESSYIARCNIVAKGQKQLYYKLMGFPAIKLSTSEVTIKPDGAIKQFLHIDTESLERALGSHMKSGDILTGVIDSSIKIEGYRYSEKRVDITADVSLNLKGRYMQIGETALSPSKITIYGDSSVIDTVSTVYTKHIDIDNPNEALNGYVTLRDSRDYLFENIDIAYKLDVEQYSEHSFEAEIEVMSDRAGNYEIIPSKVKVKCNIAKSFYKDFDPNYIYIYVEKGDSTSIKHNGGNYAGGDKYRVDYRHSLNGVDIIDITPKYVTVLNSK